MNLIFCDEIFDVTDFGRQVLAAILVSLSRTPRWPLDTFLLKMSNTRSPITLQQKALALQNLAQVCSLKLYNSINILESKSAF